MINETESKDEFSEPNSNNDRLFEHQIKTTPGLTELYWLSVQSEIKDCHLDVESQFPRIEADSKGKTVRFLIIARDLSSKRREPVWFLSKFKS